ncbi:MAG TPA: cytochrome c [Candidatus Limnocylindria bacterium]
MTVPTTPIDVGSRSIPGWAIGLTVLVFLVGGVYLAGNLSGENPPILAGASGSGSAAPNVAQQARQVIAKAQPPCTACHGDQLTGGVGPNLHGVANGPVTADLKQLATDHADNWLNLWIDGTDAAVKDIDRKGMPQFGSQLSPAEIETIVEYLKTLP